MARTPQQRTDDSRLIELIALLMSTTFSSGGNYAIDRRAMDRILGQYALRLLDASNKQGVDPRDVLQRWIRNAPQFNTRLLSSTLNESVRAGFGPPSTLLTEAAVASAIASMCPPDNDY